MRLFLLMILYLNPNHDKILCYCFTFLLLDVGEQECSLDALCSFWESNFPLFCSFRPPFNVELFSLMVYLFIFEPRSITVLLLRICCLAMIFYVNLVNHKIILLLRGCFWAWFWGYPLFWVYSDHPSSPRICFWACSFLAKGNGDSAWTFYFWSDFLISCSWELFGDPLILLLFKLFLTELFEFLLSLMKLLKNLDVSLLKLQNYRIKANLNAALPRLVLRCFNIWM